MQVPDRHLATSMRRLVDGVVHAVTTQATAAQRHQLRVVAHLHEREWTDSVGLARHDIFHQSHAAQQRVAQSVRPGTGRHLQTARQLWGTQGQEVLTRRIRELRAHLRVAGPQALDALIAGDDPLTRLALLQGLLEQLGGDHAARGHVQQSIDRLQAEEGDAIQALMNAAPAFVDEPGESGAAEGTRTAASRAPTTDPSEEAAALRRSYAALVGPRQRRQDRPLGALQLAQNLLREVGAEGFERGLERLARGATRDLDSPRPSRAAVRIRVAMTDASAFKTVRSLLAQVSRCGVRLQERIPAIELPGGRAAAEILRLADQGINDVQTWATALAGAEQATTLLDTPAALRDLRGFVSELPALLWGSAADAGRLKTLVALDQHAIALAEQHSDLILSAGRSPLDRLDPRLAAQLVAVRGAGS